MRDIDMHEHILKNTLFFAITENIFTLYYTYVPLVTLMLRMKHYSLKFFITYSLLLIFFCKFSFPFLFTLFEFILISFATDL